MAEGSREQSEEQQGLYAVLPWDKFSNWLHCICVVTFDLEIGQTLEVSIQTSLFVQAFFQKLRKRKVSLTHLRSQLNLHPHFL
jgi:hypothetical protein